MKTAYTPGPWQAGLNLPQVDNNNPDVRLVWSDSLLVCDCRSQWIEPGTAAANARLIAAAPELLGAILLLEKSASALLLHDNVTYDMKAQALNQSLLLARAAIDKATGEQP